MADRVSALLAEAPGLERASRLTTPRLPVSPAFEEILPFGGLKPGSTVGITGVGATSLALALIARLTEESWTAAVGLPRLGLNAAAELGISLDRLVVVPEPQDQWTTVLAALIDSFDVVLAGDTLARSRGLPVDRGHSARCVPRTPRDLPRLSARVRERDALLVVVGSWPQSDLTLQGTTAKWYGIGRGHGHLRTRTIDVTVSGRGAASISRNASLWLPDTEGNVTIAHETSVLPLRTVR